ncbi:MAG: outer membrane protein assembly factor BamA [Elusimicrobia bacterium]|nr:outer membrane protein assembly factor BamA [Elusimicrobiota bacterium]
MKKHILLLLLPFAFASFSAAQGTPAPAAAAVSAGASTAPASAIAQPVPVEISTETPVAPPSQPVAVVADSASTTSAVSALPGLAAFPAAETTAEKNKGPWEVYETAVKGAINVKPKVVLKTGKAKKGALYYTDYVNSDIESILGLGSMENVSVDIAELPDKPSAAKFSALSASSATARITYIVSEKPMIKEIALKGNKELSKSSVKNEMSLKEKDFFDELKMREDLIKITDKYHEKGFIDARADYEIRYDTAARLCFLTVSVSEGKKAKVAEVKLEGAKAFKLKKLVKKLKNRPKKIYSPQDFDADLKVLETYYKNNGYSDFKITSSSVSFNGDRSLVFISIAITEGARQRFGGTYFSGNTVYLSKDLAEAVAYREGKVFNQDNFDETLRAIQDKYADKGYLKAQIKPAKVPNEKTGGLDIEFGITENNPIYVDHVDVEGNKATKTYVLKREITQKEGEVFSSSKIRRSQERIFNLGFIDDVSPVINPTSDPDKVDLVFDVTEGKPGMLTAGAGISSTDGLVGTLSLSHLNLFGRAYKTSLSWSFGKRVNDYTLSWSTPWVGKHPMTLGVDLYNTRRYKPYQTTLSAYTEQRTGGRVTLAPRFQDDKYTLTTSYTYEKVRISSVEAQYAGELPEGTSVTSSIYVEFARDTRDNVWDPTRGSRIALGLDFTGGPFGGDENYYKPSLTTTYNLKLFSIEDYPFVLAASNRLGYIAHFGSTRSVPVTERYFIGGADTIRGYSNNGQIGPPNGGNVYDILNIEFKIPLAREHKRTIVQWAFFFDLGNSWNHFNNVNLHSGSGVNTLKAGAGFGIRFTTPAFPIRLDWGYGFNHKPGEQRSDIYFTLGNLF